MRCCFVPVLVGLSLLSAACGGGPRPPSSTLNSGNWTMLGTSSVIDRGVIYVGGSLSQTGNSVIGIVHVFGPECFGISDNVAISGTVRGNSITLTTGELDSQVIHVAGTVSGNDSFLATYSITGGCADQDKGNIIAQYVPFLTGTWTATDTSGTTPVSITANLTQAATSYDGFFALSGTATFVGSPCMTTGTIDPQFSFVSGNLAIVFVNTTNTEGDPGLVIMGGFLENPATATSMSGLYEVETGTCSITSYPLVLTKQP